MTGEWLPIADLARELGLPAKIARRVLLRARRRDWALLKRDALTGRWIVDAERGRRVLAAGAT